MIIDLLLTILTFIVAYVLVGAYLTYSLWRDYLAVMSLARAKEAGLLTPITNAVGHVVLIRGLLLDFLVNVFVMTWILKELPREMTVTARLKRHNMHSTGWPKKVAMWFEPILDPFDPKGDHI